MDSGSDAVDFGNLTEGRYLYDSCSNGSRGLFAGGYAPGDRDTIDYITIGTQSDAVDFGELLQARNYIPGCSGG